MNLEVAVDLDRDGKLVEASQAYEAIIVQEENARTALLNLLVLYWQVTDFGFLSKNRLSPEFVTHAGRRLRSLLSGSARYKLDSGFVFWSKYIAWADLGDSLELDECRRLLRANPTELDPAMFIFVSSGGGECVDEARVLLDRSIQDGTTRARYIESVLRATMQRYEGSTRSQGS